MEMNTLPKDIGAILEGYCNGKLDPVIINDIMTTGYLATILEDSGMKIHTCSAIDWNEPEISCEPQHEVMVVPAVSISINTVKGDNRSKTIKVDSGVIGIDIVYLKESKTYEVLMYIKHEFENELIDDGDLDYYLRPFTYTRVMDDYTVYRASGSLSSRLVILVDVVIRSTELTYYEYGESERFNTDLIMHNENVYVRNTIEKLFKQRDWVDASVHDMSDYDKENETYRYPFAAEPKVWYKVHECGYLDGFDVVVRDTRYDDSFGQLFQFRVTRKRYRNKLQVDKYDVYISINTSVPYYNKELIDLYFNQNPGLPIWETYEEVEEDCRFRVLNFSYFK